MKKVNCLYRVSSRQQLHGDDIPVQREECKNYIEQQKDWEFQKEYIEKAVSGFKTSVKDRDILQEIMEDAKRRSFDILLVFLSDRIGRKEDESPVFVTTLNKLGIEVWSVKEGQLKTEEHIDKLLNYIRFWQAEGESRKTGMRVKSAQETFAKQGKFVGGCAPFGYTLEFSGEISNHGRALKHLVIDEAKAPIVRKIYDYAIRYNYGDLKIAKTLNEEGAAAPKDTWKAATIAQILKNPIYMGHTAYCRRQRSKCGGSYNRMPMENWILSEAPNPDLMIIPRETWYLAREMREKRKASPKNGTDHTGETPSSRGKLLLMGLIYCGYCGCRLTNGSKYDYWTTKNGEYKKKYVGRYKCINRAGGSLTCRGKDSYHAKEIEPVVLSVVTSYLASLKEADICGDVLKLQEQQRKKHQKEMDGLQREMDLRQKDIETLEQNIPLALRGEGMFSVEQLSSLLEGKKKEISNLKEELCQKKKEYTEIKWEKQKFNEGESRITRWGELFAACSIPEKKVLLSRLIQRIDLRENEIKIRLKITMEEFGDSADSLVSEQRL